MPRSASASSASASPPQPTFPPKSTSSIPPPAPPTNIARKIDLLDAPADQAELWRSLDLTAEIEKATGIPTVWFNNGNAACWAELVMRPAPRPENFVYL